ncbi:hypothetical protein BOX15_Mlig022551g2, partial [Macrostomum lignano]
FSTRGYTQTQMAAALAAPANPMTAQPVDTGASSAFTPLHLFECTISNAGMLVDSMPVRDLVTALRVLSGLHSRIVDVMEPTVGAACTMAEHHKSHCATVEPSAEPAVQSPAISDCKRKRSRRSVSDDGGGGNDSGSVGPTIKCESLGAGGSEADDDCLMVMEESAPGAPVAAASSVLGGGGGGRFQDSFLSSSSYAASAACSTPELRAALKDGYKELKSAGAELFDFSRPFEDPYNVQVTQRIIACAQARVGNQGLPMDVWRGAMASLMSHFRVAEDRHAKQKANTRKHNRKYAKLSRRQKSFEALLSELAPDELEQYRLVLTRDFTTSDEESEDERGRERLRVRELPWESDRVRELKRRLDELYLRRFATHKQRDQLARCRRDGSARSSRPPPESAPDWALRPLPLPSALASLTSAQPRNGPAASDCSFDGLSGGAGGFQLGTGSSTGSFQLGTGSGSGPMPGTGSFYENAQGSGGSGSGTGSGSATGNTTGSEGRSGFLMN